MEEHDHEFKARRFVDVTVIRLIASDISYMIIQRLRLKNVRSHADAKLSMHFLGSTTVVVLSICRHFFPFLYLSMVQLSSRL